MKTKLLFFIVFISRFALAEDTPAEFTPPLPNGEKINHFVIVSGYLHGNNGNQPTMLRMDTVTGQTWAASYSDVPFPINETNTLQIQVVYWDPVSENFQTSANHIITNSPVLSRQTSKSETVVTNEPSFLKKQ